MSNHGRPSIGSFYGGGLAGNPLGGLLGSHTSAMENLQSNLKQRDGEVYHLNWEMNRLQTQRNTLANEISELSSQMEQVDELIFRVFSIHFTIITKINSTVVCKVRQARYYRQAV